MKKANFTLLLFFIMLLASCGSQDQVDNSLFSEPATSASAPSTVHGDAYAESITPSAMLQAQVDMGFPDEKNIIELTGVADYAYPMTLEAITPQSIAIVEATVNDIEYSSVGGHAWTKVTATIDAVIYGELSENDVIDFYVFGGYMPLKEYIDWWDDWSRFKDLSDDEIENSVIHSLQPNEDLPLEGEHYLFFLGEPTANMPEGTFQRLGQKFCTYHIEADGETLTHVPLVSELTEEEYLVSAQSEEDFIQTTTKTELYAQIENYLS